METAGVVVAQANVVSSLFYGYSAEVIAEWCGVSVKTASRWKAGQRQPSATAMRLFQLRRDDKVLGAEWHGWQVKDSVLVDPDGNETTRGQLQAYYLIYQLCHELARSDPSSKERLRRILSTA